MIMFFNNDDWSVWFAEMSQRWKLKAFKIEKRGSMYLGVDTWAFNTGKYTKTNEDGTQANHLFVHMLHKDGGFKKQTKKHKYSLYIWNVVTIKGREG